MSQGKWETYYRGGMISTCPTGPDGGYDLEVREAWVEFFSLLADGACILDIGTGNGVVAEIALQTAASLGRRWEIHGTDLARIDPHRNVPDGARRLAGIIFHPGVATEALPFEAGHFDAVSGHYAIEYTNTALALADIHRVLKAGADAQFIVHCSDSVLVHAAARSLREAELVLDETRIFRRLHRLLTMEQAASDAADRAGRELRDAIRSLKEQLRLAQPTSGGGSVLSVALDAVHKLLMARSELGQHAVGLEVDRVERELMASAQRLHDLRAHARTEADMQGIEQEAAAAGFSRIERLPQYHAGSNLVGWQLMLHRP